MVDAPIKRSTTEAKGEVSVSIDTLQNRISGDVLRHGDPGYDEARAIWNGMIDRHPAAIAMAESSEDVSAAISYAREHDVQFSIRGCGHNIAGTAVTPDGLMISLQNMKRIDVDQQARQVRVQPGANWGDVDVATEPHGIVVPGGIVSTTGVAGFTVGGGFGWLTRKWGFTSDSLIEATVVTADGEIRTTNANSEPDLFWAIRGGGGNFGVVTEFVFDAKLLGPEVAAGLVLWPMNRAEEVIQLFREESATAPVELTHVLVMRVAPPAPFIPEEYHGMPVVGIAAMYAGEIDTGMELMQPLKTFGKPIVDSIKPKPFREFQAFLDSGQPYGRRYYWKSVYLSEFTDSVRDALLGKATTFSSPLSSVLLPHLGGNAPESASESAAVSFRDAQFLVNYQASWEDLAGDDEHIGWARDNFEAMSPYASGQYLNFMTEDEVGNSATKAYDDETFDRLRQVKRQYDPDNVFNLNKNIEPASE